MGGLGSGRFGRRGGKLRVESCLRLPVSKVVRAEPGDRDCVAEGGCTIEHGRRKQWLPIVTTAQHSGGVRAWWSCPFCSRRVAYLFAPIHSQQEHGDFACRTCHQLCYRSQQVGRTTRWRYQAQKLYERAGTSSDADFHYKPKGMRWRTFDVLLQRAADYDHAAAQYSLCTSSVLNGLLGINGKETAANAKALAGCARHPRLYLEELERVS